MENTTEELYNTLRVTIFARANVVSFFIKGTLVSVEVENLIAAIDATLITQNYQ